MTAAELGHQRKRVVRISTGSKQLDAILGGYAVFSKSPPISGPEAHALQWFPEHEHQRGSMVINFTWQS